MEDCRRHRHPGGLCNQHVLCDCLCDGVEQRPALRYHFSRVGGLSGLRDLPGRLSHYFFFLLYHCVKEQSVVLYEAQLCGWVFVFIKTAHLVLHFIILTKHTPSHVYVCND